MVGKNSSTLTISANGQSITVPVVANILYGGSGSSGNLAISPASVAFNLQSSSSAQSQYISLSASTSTVFVATATTANGGNWLGAAPSSGVTPSTLIVSANPAWPPEPTPAP